MRRDQRQAISIRGSLILLDASVGGALYARDTTVRNSKGPALNGGGLRVGRDLYLDGAFTAEGGGNERATMRLPGARIGGLLHLAVDGVRHADHRYRWSLDGLAFTGVPILADRPHRDAWIDLLRFATPRYAAQPYQQLAAAYRAEGHDADVRAILIAQRRDQLARGGLRRADRRWPQLSGALVGFGYQPWRAPLYLIGVLAVSVTLAVGLGTHGALAVGTAHQPCTVIQTVARGLDLGTPFLPRAESSGCTITSTTAGATLTIATWILQVLTWALAALFVAGFTGIVRKT